MYIYHSDDPVLIYFKELREAIRACLAHCESTRQPSIAFPPVGTGKILKFPDILVAKVMLEECIAWSKKTNTLKVNVIVSDAESIIIQRL